MIEFAEVLGIPPALLPTYLEEVASTLASSAWKLQHHDTTAADLVDASYQDVEAAMTEGHPGFVANNGRVGFGARRLRALRAGAGRPVGWCGWRAVVTPAGCPAGRASTSPDLYDGELDEAVRERFADRPARARASTPRTTSGSGAPVAVDQQGRDHLRTRPGAP